MLVSDALTPLGHATTASVRQKPNPGNPGNPGNPAPDLQDTDKADASLRFAPLVLFKIYKIIVLVHGRFPCIGTRAGFAGLCQISGQKSGMTVCKLPLEV